MSYTLFIQRFNEGVDAPFDQKKLEHVIAKHGRIDRTEFGLDIQTHTHIAETVTLQGTDDSTSCISFHRPERCPELQRFVHELLELEGALFFDQELSFLQSKTGRTDHLPRELAEGIECRPSKVDSWEDVWPV